MRGLNRIGVLAMLSGVGISSAFASLGPSIAAPAIPLRRAVRGSPRYVTPHVTTYFPDGLNGPRAVARRLRQIERGSLTVANGLVR